MNHIDEKENNYDVNCYKEAIEEYNKDPETYTLDEVKKELELD